MLDPMRVMNEIFDASAMPNDPLALAIQNQFDFACAVHDEWREFEYAHRLKMVKHFSREHTN
jgi:hypothetical protein